MVSTSRSPMITPDPLRRAPSEAALVAPSSARASTLTIEATGSRSATAGRVSLAGAAPGSHASRAAISVSSSRSMSVPRLDERSV